MPAGNFRRVFYVGAFAVKVPRLRRLRAAMHCNRWEREMWGTWRPKFGWSNLCPIVFADPLGLVVVMVRAELSVSEAEVDAAIDTSPLITAETKPADWGRVAGHVVAVDYGMVIDSDMAGEYRTQYARPAAD